MLKFVRSRQKRKDKHKDEEESATETSSNNSSDVESVSGSNPDCNSEAEDDELQGIEGSALAASNILEQPLVPDEENEDFTSCLICPGKLLKNSKMVEVHANSSSHQRRVKRFEKCAKDLESETNQHPTLHAVLYRMDTSVVDLAPKPHKRPRKVRNNSGQNPEKPKLSRREKKLARKGRRESAASVAASPSTTAVDQRKDMGGPHHRTAKLESRQKEVNAPQNLSEDDQAQRRTTYKRKSDIRDGGMPRKKEKVMQKRD